ncbi:MAG: hypothetical protein K6T68_01180 [Alicyclobacillus shizuokensis]|nr:hypothetical protein [Alicyclobacillus shizuokensis]
MGNGEPLGANANLPAPVDLHKSLQPFLIVYNREEKSVQSTGYVNGQVPPLPQGVLRFTRQHHEDRVTWQPAPGIRIAAVVVSYGGNGGGYVLASRSLRVVEERESSLFNTVGIAYLSALLLLAAILGAWWHRVRKSRAAPSAG